MNNHTQQDEILNIIQAVHYRPALSVLLPFDSKGDLIHTLPHSLKLALQKARQEMCKNYPDELCEKVTNRVEGLIANLKIDTSKKSIALFASPVFEKVVFLDVPVTEKIIIDESFEIRDLLYNKKQAQHYLVFILSAKEKKLFLYDSDHFIRIPGNPPDTVDAFVNDIAERVANFSDISDRKEIITEKFLRHADKGLDEVLQHYKLPLFVLGAEKLLGHFKKVSHHENAVTAFVTGNYEEYSLDQLQQLLQPFIAQLKETQRQELMNKLDTAAGEKVLSVGIQEVWQEAKNKKGKLLVVDKNFMYAAQLSGESNNLVQAEADPGRISVIKDAVDDIIEQVVGNGGDVEFADPPLPEQYQHIALVRYY